MKNSSIIKYLIIGGITFIIAFSFLQSLHLSYERTNIELIVKGENINNLRVNYTNKFARNVEIDTLKNHSSNTFRFLIPDYAYVRYLQLKFDEGVNSKISEIVFSRDNYQVAFKNNDIKRLFYVPQHVYDRNASTFNKNNLYIPQKIVISSKDLSSFVESLHINRISQSRSIVISALFSIFSIVIFWLVQKYQKQSFKVSSAIFAIVSLLSLLIVQRIFFNTKIDLQLYNDSNKYNLLKSDIPGNLFYNGDFKYGLLFWGYSSKETKIELINTLYGKAVKISRGIGNGGDWQLKYEGRPIQFYKGHTYQIKFKYKVETGKGIPFYVGWWVVEGGTHKYHLPLESQLIKDNWFEGVVRYTFKDDSINPICFLNSMADNSVILVTDIQLTDLDRTSNQIDFVER